MSQSLVTAIGFFIDTVVSTGITSLKNQKPTLMGWFHLQLCAIQVPTYGYHFLATL
jgi:hypothetical protein